jgi:ArsR family transcriptional regulator
VKAQSDDTGAQLTGDALAGVLAALANPQRLRIIAVLASGRVYVSELARAVGLSRPLVHMHLQRLEAAGLVTGSLELSPDGKAMKFFDVVPFSYCVTPALVTEAVATLTPEKPSPRRAQP